MLDSVLNYVDELQSSVKNTKEFLFQLRGGRTRLVNQINKAEEVVAGLKDQSKYIESLKPSLKETAIQAAKDIMYGQIIEASNINIEFSEPEYREALLEAIEKSETYKFSMRGSSWNSIASIDIDLNKTAGRLNMWASGVKQARKQFGTKVPRKDSKRRKLSDEQASNAWRAIWEKRDTKDTFSKTIRTRLTLSGALAPFWQLLDKGDVPLKSDRGGYPTPSKKPTNFVDQSETAVNNYMATVMTQERQKYIGLFDNYNKLLYEARLRLLDIEKTIEDVSLEVARLREVKRAFGEDSKYIDDNKLGRAALLVKQSLLTTGRVELTKRGSPKRVRPSVSRLANLI